MLQEHMLWIVVRIAYRGDSNKYPEHVFLGVNSQKASLLLPFILLHVGILYSSKFVLTAKFMEQKLSL